MSDLINVYRRRVWSALKDGTLTIEQLAATDDKTSKLLPCGDVLISTANWAREQMRIKNAADAMAHQNEQVKAKRSRRKKAA